jgi:hypothetical protein
MTLEEARLKLVEVVLAHPGECATFYADQMGMAPRSFMRLARAVEACGRINVRKKTGFPKSSTLIDVID